MLRGQTALITGAGRGIGRAVALAFAREGAKLVLAARTAADLDAVAAECEAAEGNCGEKVRVHAVDLGTPEGVDGLANFVLSDGVGCDVIVNNAGYMMKGNATTGDADDWDRGMYINLNGPMRLTRKLAPKMAERMRGAIINVGSIASIEGMSGETAVYAASKHGLRGWTTSIYQTMRHSNVKVMLINPAFVNTPMVQGNDRLCYDRMIQPEDVAEVCLLPFRVSAGCVPSEVTLRLTLSAFKD